MRFQAQATAVRRRPAPTPRCGPAHSLSQGRAASKAYAPLTHQAQVAAKGEGGQAAAAARPLAALRCRRGAFLRARYGPVLPL